MGLTDREINEAVARKLGWACNDRHCNGDFKHTCGACGKYGHGNCYGDGTGAVQVECDHMPDYCHSIEAAWEIVSRRKLIFKCEFAPYLNLWKASFEAFGWCCGEERHNPSKDWKGEADTAPMVICLAFLKIPY